MHVVGRQQDLLSDVSVECGARDLMMFRYLQVTARRGSPLFERGAPDHLGAERQPPEPEAGGIE